MVGYKIAKPSEYLIITGAGITDIKITKKVLDGQQIWSVSQTKPQFLL